MTDPQQPDRRDVQRIINEVSAEHGVRAYLVACGAKGRLVTTARYVAIVRILKETGCSEQGLSTVWGISTCAIHNAKVRAGLRQPKRQIYDRNTIDRLKWCHGAHRATQIARGGDRITNTDIAAWRNLGKGAA